MGKAIQLLLFVWIARSCHREVQKQRPSDSNEPEWHLSKTLRPLATTDNNGIVLFINTIERDDRVVSEKMKTAVTGDLEHF